MKLLDSRATVAELALGANSLEHNRHCVEVGVLVNTKNLVPGMISWNTRLGAPLYAF